MSGVDIGLYVMYFLFGGAVVLAIGLSLFNAIKTPGAFMKSLIGVGGLIVLFGIAYAVAGSSVTQEQMAKGISEGTSKMIGAGLILLYISLGLSIIGLIYSEINKALN